MADRTPPDIDASEPPVDPASALRELLRAGEGRGVPKGGVRRTYRMARAALSTSLSVTSGRLRGRGRDEARERGGGGLRAADRKAIERLVSRLGELKGLAMKMGQILSYIDDTLPPEMRQLLSLLQTQSQPAPLAQIQQVITEDLGDQAPALLDGLEPTPVSVASIGQVHRATLPDGGAVAVKVLHPGIREALQSDFNTARIGPAVASLLMPGSKQSLRSFIGEMRDRMLEECDYALEAEHQVRFGRLLRDVPGIVVPAVRAELGSSRVLVTDWEPGMDLESFLATAPDAAWRDRAGEALFQVYFGTLYRHGWFHADPHPGNYAFRSDGRIVIYDFGCVRRFDADTVRALSSLAHAVARDEEPAIRQAMQALGGEIPDDPQAFDHVRVLLRGFFSPMLQHGVRAVDAGVNFAMGDVVKDKRMLMRLNLPGKLLFLFRIRFGLYAVLARLGARGDWAALEESLADQALSGAEADSRSP
jgi:predicted unusual protein kinase regulating ubiquinone biosynthesis (AarF/ABC1/UbiB family)